MHRNRKVRGWWWGGLGICEKGKKREARGRDGSGIDNYEWCKKRKA